MRTYKVIRLASEYICYCNDEHGHVAEIHTIPMDVFGGDSRAIAQAIGLEWCSPMELELG